MQEKVENLSVEKIGGGTPSTNVEEYWNGDIPWIQSSDVKNKELFNIIPEKYISNEAIKNSSAKIIKENSISIVTRVGVGKVAYIPFEFSTSQDFLSLQNLLVDPIFGTYSIFLLMSKLSYQTQGTSIKGITNDQLLNSFVSIPKFENEQKLIAKLLYKLEKIIALEQEKLHQYQQIKAFFRQKLFPKKEKTFPEMRFADFEGSWKKKKLEELGSIFTGNTPRTSNSEYYHNEGMPWVTPTDIECMEVKNTGKKLSTKGVKVARVVPKGAILITSIASIGKNALVAEKVAFNQQINALVPYEENDSYFLYIQSYLWSEHMKKIASTGTMQIINKSEFSKLLSVIPSYEEQQKIGKLFKQLDKIIKDSQLILKSYKKTKSLLLSNMFI